MGRLSTTECTYLPYLPTYLWCTAAGTVKWRYLWAPELSPIGSM